MPRQESQFINSVLSKTYDSAALKIGLELSVIAWFIAIGLVHPAAAGTNDPRTNPRSGVPMSRSASPYAGSPRATQSPASSARIARPQPSAAKVWRTREITSRPFQSVPTRTRILGPAPAVATPRISTERTISKPAPAVLLNRVPSSFDVNTSRAGAASRPDAVRVERTAPPSKPAARAGSSSSFPRTPLQNSPAGTESTRRPQPAVRPGFSPDGRQSTAFNHRTATPFSPPRTGLDAITALALGRAADRASRFAWNRHDRLDHWRPFVHGSRGYYGSCYRPLYLYSYPFFVPTYGYAYSNAGFVTYYPDSLAGYDYAPTYTASTYAQPGPAYVSQPATSHASDAEMAAGDAYSVPTQAQPSVETAARQSDPMVLAAVRDGNSAFAVGRYDDARRAYVRAVLLDEKDGAAKLLYGLASFAEGDYAVAATALRRALVATPDLIDYPFNIVALYGSDARFNEQLNALSRHIGSNPEDREALLLLGYLQYASGGAAESQVVFGAIADADPTDDLAVFLRDAAIRAAQAGRARPTAPRDEVVP